MKLQGIAVANMKKFREYFTLREASMLLNQFVRDFSPNKVFYTEERERRLYRFIQFYEEYREKNGEQGNFFPIEIAEGKCVVIMEESEGEYQKERLEKAIAGQEELEQLLKLEGARERPILLAELLVLCELAHYSGRAEEFADLLGFKEQTEKGVEVSQEIQRELTSSKTLYETDQGIIFAATVEKYSFPHWMPITDDKKKQPIKTKRLIRESYSSYSGSVEIQCTDREGKIIQGVSIPLEYQLYANFIGDRLVEVLPNKSQCGEYQIYRNWDESGRSRLRREKNKAQEHEYEVTSELERMSSFAALEDGGFVGISEGKLLGYTSVVRLPALAGEIPVKVCAKNGLYAVLTDRGEVITNFTFPHKNICIICMDESGYLYGLGREGEVHTNRPDQKKFLSEYKQIIWMGYEEEERNLFLRNAEGVMHEIPIV